MLMTLYKRLKIKWTGRNNSLKLLIERSLSEMRGFFYTKITNERIFLYFSSIYQLKTYHYRIYYSAVFSCFFIFQDDESLLLPYILDTFSACLSLDSGFRQTVLRKTNHENPKRKMRRLRQLCPGLPGGGYLHR